VIPPRNKVLIGHLFFPGDFLKPGNEFMGTQAGIAPVLVYLIRGAFNDQRIPVRDGMTYRITQDRFAGGAYRVQAGMPPAAILFD
jgi:hypothetical protein